jgi:hypothetical protein
MYISLSYYLMMKIEGRVRTWCYRWLSRGGILSLTLVKYVLEGILMHWLSSIHILKGILEKTRKTNLNFV